ncbi:MAG: metallophosphoesterase family protein [Corynebacterium sp.]|nr:metallophosphoesterase family protein [Corynebacterium sp.]
MRHYVTRLAAPLLGVALTATVLPAHAADDPVFPTAGGTYSVTAAVGEDANSVTITWRQQSGLVIDQFLQVVKHGEGFARAENITPFAHETTPGHYYRATATGLAANTIYDYRVGSEDTGWSQTFSLTTGTQATSWRFAAIGASQVGNSTGQFILDSLSQRLDSLGGISFIADTGEDIGSGTSSWQFAQATDLWRAHPMAPVNVESTSDNEFWWTTYQPNRGTVAPTTRNWWTVHNNTLIIGVNWQNSVSSTANYVKKIAAEHGASAAWTVVVMHANPFGVGSPTDAYTTDDKQRATIGKAFNEAGVDLVLTGRDHLYSRTYPMTGVTGDTSLPAETYSQWHVDGHQTVWMSLNSATTTAIGKTFYDRTGTPQTLGFTYALGESKNLNRDEIAYWQQDNRNSAGQDSPDYSIIDVTDTTLTVTTRNLVDDSLVDQFTLTRSAGAASSTSVPVTTVVPVNAPTPPTPPEEPTPLSTAPVTTTVTATATTTVTAPGAPVTTTVTAPGAPVTTTVTAPGAAPVTTTVTAPVTTTVTAPGAAVTTTVTAPVTTTTTITAPGSGGSADTKATDDGAGSSDMDPQALEILSIVSGIAATFGILFGVVGAFREQILALMGR